MVKGAWSLLVTGRKMADMSDFRRQRQGQGRLHHREHHHLCGSRAPFDDVLMMRSIPIVDVVHHILDCLWQRMQSGFSTESNKTKKGFHTLF
jgi:hypothetical protein